MVSVANGFRLGFMTAHVLLLLAAFIQGMVQINSLIILIMGLISAIPMIIYIPIAGILTMRRKWTWWDMACVELPYVIVETILWFLLGVFATLSQGSWVCTGDPPAGGRRFHFDNQAYAGSRYCHVVNIFLGLAWANFSLLFVWLVFTLVAMRVSSNNADRPWRTSMGLIMEGDKAVLPLPKGKEAEVEPMAEA